MLENIKSAIIFTTIMKKLKDELKLKLITYNKSLQVKCQVIIDHYKNESFLLKEKLELAKEKILNQQEKYLINIRKAISENDIDTIRKLMLDKEKQSFYKSKSCWPQEIFYNHTAPSRTSDRSWQPEYRQQRLLIHIFEQLKEK